MRILPGSPPDRAADEVERRLAVEHARRVGDEVARAGLDRLPRRGRLVLLALDRAGVAGEHRDRIRALLARAKRERAPERRSREEQDDKRAREAREPARAAEATCASRCS